MAAYASWLNISVANSRIAFVYRAWKAVSLLSGDMAGKWTVVDTSDGATPAWTDDSSPGNGGWVVLQNETANADSTKMQVFIGARTSSGALAGFGTKAAGCWWAASPIGGFDTTNHYFGASLADWRNSSLSTVSGADTAVTMMLVLTAGDSVTHRPGGFYQYHRTGSGSHYGYSARHLLPFTGGSVAKTRFAYSFGTWQYGSVDGYYNASRNGVAKTSLDGWDTAGFGSAGTSEFEAPGQDAEDSTFVGVPMICTDVTLSKSRGYTQWPLGTKAGDGDLNGAAGSATLWAWGRFLWPREPSRDGAWV